MTTQTIFLLPSDICNRIPQGVMALPGATDVVELG